MLTLKLDIKKRNPLLSRVRTLSVQAQFSNSTDQQIPVASIIRQTISSTNIFNDAVLTRIESTNGDVTIEDLRGRPAESFTEPITINTPGSKNRQEELISAKGVINVLPESGDETAQEPTNLPFFFRINTEFSTFKGSNHILHSLKTFRSESIKQVPIHLLVRKLDELIPIEVHSGRIGTERFRAHYFTSLLGLMPRISERFYLEVSQATINLFYEIEFPAGDDLTATVQNSILKELDIILKSNAIYQSLLSEITEQL